MLSEEHRTLKNADFKRTQEFSLKNTVEHSRMLFSRALLRMLSQEMSLKNLGHFV